MVKRIDELFDVWYGNKFDLNKMQLANDSSEKIAFVSRSSKNLGVASYVRKLREVEPYPPGLITVALGGAILSSFVQQQSFYTAQNVAILKPKAQMSFQEKIFYCKCIEENKFRYSTFGREANRTLRGIKVPDRVPEWIKGITLTTLKIDKPSIQKEYDLYGPKWAWFTYDDLFEIERGRGARKKDVRPEGLTYFITSSDQNNGVVGKVNSPPSHPRNVITVARNGSVGEAFYQSEPFCSTEDIHVFKPKFHLNIYTAMFLTTLIRKEKYRYSFGRKWGLERMRRTKILLPIDKNNLPNWKFIEEYIKSLRYSKELSRIA